MLDPRSRAGADLAAFGHDAIYDVDSGANSAGGVSRARGQDDDGAVGGGRRGPPAQAASGKPADVFAPSHHQRRDGRIELENPEHQIGGLRLPQLPKLPDSHPVLLRKAQPLPTMIREETKG